MFKRYSLILFSFLILSCSNSKLVESKKMDAPLKNRIAELEELNSAEPIKVFGKCAQQISDQMKNQLETTGANIESTINDIFTASGSSEQIRKLANLDFVSQLSLSTKSKPLK